MTSVIAFLVALFILTCAVTAGAYAESQLPTNKVGDVLYRILVMVDALLLACIIVMGALYYALTRHV